MPKQQRKRSSRLPKQLIPFPCADKEFHESWAPGRDLLALPHPWRGVLLGPPNSGKSTTVKNIMIRADPPFQKMVVIHCDPEHSKEYDDCNAEVIGEIPPPEAWEGQEKTIVVVDDLDTKRMSKDQASALDRLFGYVSTHKNISCVLCSQDAFNVPAGIRRCANLWVLWPSADVSSISNCTRRCGNIPFQKLFNNLCKSSHDAIWVDLSDKSPAKVRFNGYHPLQLT